MFPNGDSYEGRYSNGKRSGSGVYRFKNGARYIGEYQDGLKHGKGKFFYPDGSKYDGDFLKGKRYGHGVFVYANGDIFDGEWENDLKHGHGVYTYAESGAKVCPEYEDTLNLLIWIEGRKLDEWIFGWNFRYPLRRPSSAGQLHLQRSIRSPREGDVPLHRL